jgi:hypothetical protein
MPSHPTHNLSTHAMSTALPPPPPPSLTWVKDAEAKFEDDLAAYTKATPTATYRHPSSFDTVSDGAGGDRADAIKLQENDTRRTAKTWMMEGDTHAHVS